MSNCNGKLRIQLLIILWILVGVMWLITAFKAHAQGLNCAPTGTYSVIINPQDALSRFAPATPPKSDT